VTPQARAAAICAVAIVPFLLGWLSFGMFVRIQPLDGVWRYGAFSSSDRMAVLLSQIVVPTLGGPLLGIALARWVRFPGTAIVAFLFLYGWVSLISILAWAHSNSLPFVMLRFFAPFTFFTLTDGPYNVDTWRGSPWFFVGWQLGLCAAAFVLDEPASAVVDVTPTGRAWRTAVRALAGSVLLGFAIACVARRYSGEPGTQASAAAFVLIVPGFLPFAARWVQTFPVTGPDPRGLSSTTFWWLAGTACLAAIAASVPEFRRRSSP
jgi:hypothetical protein